MKSGRYPGIDQFLQFLENVSRELNDPVFGIRDEVKRSDRKPKSSSFHVTVPNGKTRSISKSDVSRKENLCLKCHQNHIVSLRRVQEVVTPSEANICKGKWPVFQLSKARKALGKRLQIRPV